jgi:prepilin signal peptidase PulO-like enzyme (type II secretory pathway)
MDTNENYEYRRALRISFDEKGTEELLEIWKKHDLGEWTVEALGMVDTILKERRIDHQPSIEDTVVKMESIMSKNEPSTDYALPVYHCPYCHGSYVYQRMATEVSTKKALSRSFWTTAIISVVIFVYRVYAAYNNVYSVVIPDPFSSGPYGTGNERFYLAIGLIFIISFVIFYFASRENKIYYECIGCKRTW